MRLPERGRTRKNREKENIESARGLLDIFRFMQQKERADFHQLVLGGGRWIRTTEVTDNRFTVCPLWPLGKSSVIGAGDRSRTYNLLITSQLLCH